MNQILGISEEHDAGIAYLEEGKLVWAANEERYTRKKFQRGIPIQALTTLKQELLRQQKPLPHTVVIGSRFHVSEGLGEWLHLDPTYDLLERIVSMLKLDKYIFGTWLGPAIINSLGSMNLAERERKIRRAFAELHWPVKTLRFYDHHLSHAFGAYIFGKKNPCVVVTQDASGDGLCSTAWIGKNGVLHSITTRPFFHSPGHYYEYVTLLFGFKIGREGKVTGLAAQGDPTYTFPIFLKEFSYDTQKKIYRNHGKYRRAEMQRLKILLSPFCREDIAAGIQKHLEYIMTCYIKDLIEISHLPTPVDVVVSGGVFANVKLNQVIGQLKEVKSLAVYPHMGDGGLAAGAAFLYGSSKNIPVMMADDVYLGDVPEELATVQKKYRKSLIFTKPMSLARETAHLLSKGKVVAVVRGRMEYGPRALGHRSLLSQATDPSVNDWLNKRLKRSEFMPFAPILKAQYLKKYFTNWEKVEACLPYMTVTVNCTDLCKREAPAIVHVDGTARPQVVTKISEPFIFDVLGEYEKKTKLRILINTSYNIHEQPIVRTSEEALKTFEEGNIDALVLNDWLVTRRK